MASSGKESVTYLDIDERSEGQRLDNFLLRVCKGVPKSHIYRVVRSGEVRVNGGRRGADYRLQIADRVRLPPLRLASPQRTDDLPVTPASARGVEIPVLFEDDRIIAVDKPAGLAVHGGSGNAAGLVEVLRCRRPEEPFIELAHRLDKDTSGVLLLAKRRPTLRRLHDLFRSGGLDKRYLVLVAGEWRAGREHVRLPLLATSDENGEKHVLVDAGGRDAHSIFRPLAVVPSASLLEARIKTGRTHQIRVHLAHLGYPVIGDERYGDFALNRELRRAGLRRMFLHAHSLAFVHPESGAAMLLRSPLAPDLRRFLAGIEGIGEALGGRAL
jgi:23S rRNA pseudouridine955/2504/2580 synthase